MKNSIIAQVDYIRSANLLATQKNIIRTKLSNCRYLLTRFRNTRKNSDLFRQILSKQNHIYFEESQLVKCLTTQDILLLEARAAKHYWEAIRSICTQDAMWSRVYPHAKDGLNLAFNIGYTYLFNLCKNILTETGLERSLGIIHSPSNENALVFDFMELYRQIAVDSIIIPLFSRKRAESESVGGKIISKIQERLQDRYVYERELIPLLPIMRKEAIKLKTAIIDGKEWKPFRFQWGNSMRKKLISEIHMENRKKDNLLLQVPANY